MVTVIGTIVHGMLMLIVVVVVLLLFERLMYPLSTNVSHFPIKIKREYREDRWRKELLGYDHALMYYLIALNITQLSSFEEP